MRVVRIIAKTFGWLIAAILALVLLVSLAIQTRPVKKQIAKIAQTEVNKILNMQLRIKNINGNFFSHLGVEDAYLEYNSDTVAYIPELKLTYKLLPLLRGDIVVHSVELIDPFISVVQYPDSTWNFQYIVKPSEKEDTVSKPFGMRLLIDKIKITNANIRTNTLLDVIPRSISNFHTDLSFKFSTTDLEIDSREFYFTAFEPDLTLKKLTFQAKKDTAAIQLKDFVLQTQLNELTADGLFNTKKFVDSHINLHTLPIHAEEFQFLFPELRVIANPVLVVSGKIDDSRTHVNLDVNNQGQAIRIEALSDNLAAVLAKKTNDELRFQMKSEFKNLNLKKWIRDPSMDYKFTGTLEAKGVGSDPKQMKGTLKADFKNMELLKRDVQKLVLNLNYQAGDVKGTLKSLGNFGSISITPNVQGLWGAAPRYTASIHTEQLDLSKLLLNDSLTSNIELNANVVGRGFDPKTLSAKIAANLKNAEVKDFSVGELNMLVDYKKGDAEGMLYGVGDFGQITVIPQVRRLMSRKPNYEAKVFAQNFNLAPLLGNDTLASDLNVIFDVVGSGFDFKTMDAHANLFAFPSVFSGVNIQKIAADVDLNNQNIGLQSLLLSTETVELSAQGTYSLSGETDLSLDADILNASEISSIAGIDSLEVKGKLQANLFGRLDSLEAFVNFDLDSLSFKGNTAKIISGQANGLLAKNDTLIHAILSAKDVAAAGFTFDQISMQANSNIRTADLVLNADGKEVSLDLIGDVNLQEDIFVRLETLDFGYKGSDWKLIESPTTIRITDNEYEINELKLISGNEQAPDSVQIIHADGLVTRVGEQKLDLKLFNINIPSVLNLFDVQTDVKGALDMNLYLRGTAQEPYMEGGFNVNKGAFSGYKFTEIAGTVDFVDKMLDVDIGVVPQDSGLLVVEGKLPFEAQLDSMRFKVPTGEDSLNIHVLIDKLPLKIARAFYPLDDVDGFVQSKIAVDGTINNPNPVGDLRIVKGKLGMKQYGVNYKNIEAKLLFDKEAVKVDTFFIRSKEGTMFANGDVGFNSQFYKGDIKNSEIDIRFQNFHPINHKYYNMELSGDVALHGKKDSLYFDGDVNVLDALVYLPAVMNLVGSGTPPEIPMPMLISELERTGEMPDSVIFKFRTDTRSGEKVKFDYFDNLQGSIKVFIPRNTWIKNEQMRFELSGDVELVKHHDFMELFGTVDVIRGQYELLGKTFIVDEGTITLQGGEELNPKLNVTASYNIRSQNNSGNTMTINVTGDLKEPKISFKMGDDPLTEGDALSYILFGTNMDALTSGQESALNVGSAGAIATEAAASLVSSELTKLLGKTLNVDYIEMRAGGSFENATFVVGKYLTNKLFMSYERRFGDFKDEKVAEYEVRLEYELFRFLFLQLASSSINNGADVIFKMNSKMKFKK